MDGVDHLERAVGVPDAFAGEVSVVLKLAHRGPDRVASLSGRLRGDRHGAGAPVGRLAEEVEKDATSSVAQAVIVDDLVREGGEVGGTARSTLNSTPKLGML